MTLCVPTACTPDTLLLIASIAIIAAQLFGEALSLDQHRQAEAEAHHMAHMYDWHGESLSEVQNYASWSLSAEEAEQDSTSCRILSENF